MKTKIRQVNDGSKANVAGINILRRPTVSCALALALFVSGSASAAPDAATINNTSVLLTDSLQALYTDSASSDTQYWSNGFWTYRNNIASLACELGPSSAAGVLFQWRQKHNYTLAGADAATNSWLRSTASTGVTSMLTYLGADGSFPDPDPALAEINNAYLTLRDTLDANSRKKWLNAMMQITTFLIVDGDLPDPAKTGWQGTSGWYTNGNYEALEALDLYQMYLATGDSRYKDLFDTQWASTLNPDATKWPNFGLRYTTTPQQNDGSDGKGYLVETPDRVNFGYDGDYTQYQSAIVGRLYLMLPDQPRLRTLNLLTNQLLQYVDKSTWILDARNGSRHSLYTGFVTESMDVLAWAGGRTDLAGYAASQFAQQINGNFLGNASQNWASPGLYRAYANEVAVLLQSDLTTTSIPAPVPAPTAVVSNGQITLSWLLSNGAISYNVKRATASGGPYTPIANSPPAIYTDETASNGVPYYYVVSAVNRAGESVNSAPVQATAAAVVPAAPTAVVSTAGDSRAMIVWLKSTGATSYHVKRATTSGGPYTTVASNLTAINISPYIDAGLNNGTPYYYVVTGVNLYGESVNSPETSTTPQYLPAPRIVSATSPTSGQTALTWLPSRGATNYTVKRSTTNGGPYTAVANLGNVTTYTDTGLSNATTYYYVVSAVSGGREGANSPQASIAASAVPVSTNVLARPGSTAITVTWAPPVDGNGNVIPTSYNIKRGTGGAYTLIGTASNTAGATFVDTTAASGTLYYYVVSDLIGSVEGQNSAWASATLLPNTLPSTPTNLAANATATQATVNWTGVSGAASYTLKRSTINNGPYTTVFSGSTATSFTDTRVTGGTRYYYVVSAVNGSGEGANSTQAATSVAPIAPTTLAATAGTKQATLGWQASVGATSYNVKRAAASGGPYSLVSSTGALTLTDTPLTSGSTYYYVVTAVNAGGESGNSTPVSVIPQ